MYPLSVGAFCFGKRGSLKVVDAFRALAPSRMICPRARATDICLVAPSSELGRASGYFLAAADASVPVLLLRRRGGAAAAEVDRVAAATVVVPPPVSATALIGRQPLDDAVARQHTSVDGKVAAHHEGTHRRVLLRQAVGFVGEIGLVLPAVDEHQTGEAGRVPVRLVQGVSPSSTPTQTCRALSVAHFGEQIGGIPSNYSRYGKAEKRSKR
jgi:hypothetical protein